MSRFLAASSVVVLCAGIGLQAAPVSRSPRQRPLAVFLEEPSPASRKNTAAGIVALGGRVLHAFDDVLVVELPAGGELAVSKLAGVQEVVATGTPASTRRGRPGAAFGQAAWNAIVRGPGPVDRGEAVPLPLEDDALTPPQVSLEAVRAASKSLARLDGGMRAPGSGAVATYSAPFGATALNTSEFLAGSVSVNIVLVESDGSIDAQSESWSATRENEVVSGIAAGLEWIRLQEPQAALRFVYHVIPGRTDARARTGYEPIRRAADPSGTTGEDLWVKEILGKLGYASGDRFARSRAFASDTRSVDGTDWAVNVFVVDSLADTDGKFADSRFAYCWIGGPHLVMTYDNQAWGIGRMDMVLRHELLHAFYAFDEYASSSCDCTSHRGYLDGVNTNCAACNPVASACVMISNGDAMCNATRRHLGWADLDGDGAIDVIGQDPDTFLDALPSNVCGATVIAGMASVVAATNRNTYPGTTHPSISVNRISGVEYRIDGSPWASAQAAGSAWGDPQERFSATLPVLVSGSHHVEVRAVDDYGNRDGAPVAVDFSAQSAVSPLGDTVRAQRSGTGSVAMSWDACAGAVLYRVYRKSSPAGAGSLVAETSQTSWTDGSPAIGYYQVHPVDACGAERSD